MPVSIRTKNTAITVFWLKGGTTTGALISRHSIIIGHFFLFNMAAMRTGEFSLVMNFHNYLQMIWKIKLPHGVFAVNMRACKN